MLHILVTLKTLEKQNMMCCLQVPVLMSIVGKMVVARRVRAFAVMATLDQAALPHQVTGRLSIHSTITKLIVMSLIACGY